MLADLGSVPGYQRSATHPLDGGLRLRLKIQRRQLGPEGRAKVQRLWGTGRGAVPLLEFRLVLPGPAATGRRGREGRPHEAARRRRPGIHPPAGQRAHVATGVLLNPISRPTTFWTEARVDEQVPPGRSRGRTTGDFGLFPPLRSGPELRRRKIHTQRLRHHSG